jgi:hypothetical protein
MDQAEAHRSKKKNLSEVGFEPRLASRIGILYNIVNFVQYSLNLILSAL